MSNANVQSFLRCTIHCALVIMLSTTAHFAIAAPETNPQSCEAKAVSKDGKPLHGAAKSAFLAKCNKDHQAQSCEDKAIDKNGKKLAGAAKASFIKKCQASS